LSAVPAGRGKKAGLAVPVGRVTTRPKTLSIADVERAMAAAAALVDPAALEDFLEEAATVARSHF
jgi:hypothetical protein